MFPRNCWYVAAWDHEVRRLHPMRRLLLGEPVVLYRVSDGTPVALEDRCCHRHAQLSRGRVRGDTIECAYHGLRFAPDGACVHIPSQTHIPAAARVRSYPVTERYHWIWIWPGDPALADESLIPDFGVMDHPDWNWRGETLPVAGNAMLVIENLMDLTHLPVLHRTTLADTAIPENDIPVEYRSEGDAIRGRSPGTGYAGTGVFSDARRFRAGRSGRPLDQHDLHAAEPSSASKSAPPRPAPGRATATAAGRSRPGISTRSRRRRRPARTTSGSRRRTLPAATPASASSTSPSSSRPLRRTSRSSPASRRTSTSIRPRRASTLPPTGPVSRPAASSSELQGRNAPRRHLRGPVPSSKVALTAVCFAGNLPSFLYYCSEVMES